MKQVIKGLTYNTETAERICSLGSDGTVSRSDFGWWSAGLYRTKKGRYFMAGCGCASSPFSHSMGGGGYCGSEGIKPLTPAEALAYAEPEMNADDLAAFFPDLIEEA